MDSVKSIRKSRRKPVNPKPSKSRTSANAPRDAKRSTSLADMGTGLRNVMIYLKRMESYIAVVGKALKGGIDPAEDEAFARRSVSDFLSKQVHALQAVAAQRRG